MRKERRGFNRVPISANVRAKHGDLSVIKAKAFDISVGGTGILSPKELPKSKIIELEMKLPDHLIIARAEVAWTKEVERRKSKFYQTGICFSKLICPTPVSLTLSPIFKRRVSPFR